MTSVNYLDAKMIEILICTFNPDIDKLSLVTKSIAHQTLPPNRVLIVDNASNPPLSLGIASDLLEKGIGVRLLREEAPGIAHARRKAIEETDSHWIVWVDDDNELDGDFLENGLAFINQHPEVGCFGGVLKLPHDLHVEEWVAPFLPYLAIRDYGSEPIIKMSDEWGHWEPATAGAWVHRRVLAAYAAKVDSTDRAAQLGRKGTLGLESSEDSLMMRLAKNQGLANAYCPSLRLTHHISRHRLTFPYLLSLLTAYGRSEAKLRSILDADTLDITSYRNRDDLSQNVAAQITDPEYSMKFRIALMAYKISSYFHLEEMRKFSRENRISITLVTACLNAGATIERTLRSIEEQKYENLEYIIYDGGSSDDTLEIISRYGHIVNKVVSEKDEGVAHALNKGFEKATGIVRGYLNADDTLEPGSLDVVSALFNSDPDTDVVTGGCRRIYADGSEVITQVPDRFLRVMGLRNDIEQPSTYWRADLHRRCGTLDQSFRLAFDWERWNRLKLEGARFRRTKRILSTYYFSEDNLTSRGGATVIREMYNVTKKYESKKIADLYYKIYEQFDLDGFYDETPPLKAEGMFDEFRQTIAKYELEYGHEVVESYNWNWASKQVRGLKWY